MENKNLNLEQLSQELTEKGREFYLAGLGAFAQTQEEGTKLFEMLTEKGKEVAEYMQALQRRTFNLREEAEDLLKEGEKMTDKLVEKGEVFEQQSLKQLKSWIEDVQNTATQWQKNASNLVLAPVEKLYAPVQEIVNTTLERIGVPSFNEVKDLNQQVAALTQKVDELAALLAAAQKPEKKATKSAKVMEPAVEVEAVA